MFLSIGQFFSLQLLALIIVPTGLYRAVQGLLLCGMLSWCLSGARFRGLYPNLFTVSKQKWVCPSLRSLQFNLPLRWTMVMTDPILSGCGGVLDLLLDQGCWTPEEAQLPIYGWELGAIGLSLEHWTDLFRGLLIRIQSDNFTMVAYV